ncbi:MAG: peptidoglycan DD-metalloendopeptidase family protein [Rhodocyclaceae bacterium]|nr:peptidoglycan DD-metalloendopeptidase family protein [Rhodocyclaceae bacterium]
MIRLLAALMVFGLAGCASRAPVPVSDTQSTVRIEGSKAAQPAAPAGKLYTVKKGDTLFGIAREQGVNPRDLAAWNNLDNSNRIAVGQALRLSPPAAAVPATVPSMEGTEVRPIAGGGIVVARPLDGGPAVSPAPTLLPGNTETLKRAPKGGKLPYSEDNLALLKLHAGAPPPAVAPQPAPTAAPAAASPPPSMPVTPAAAAPAAPADSGGIEWGWPAAGRLLANFSEAGSGAQEMSKGIDIAGKVGDPVQAAAAGKVIYVGVFPKHGNLVVVLHAGGYSSVYAHNSRILVKEGQMVKRGQKIADLGNSDADQPKLHFEVRQQGKPVDPLKFLPSR